MDVVEGEAGGSVLQREVELILVRQLAGYLTQAMLVVDTRGALIHVNEPAERLLGLRFEETEELDLDTWTRSLAPSSIDGRLLDQQERPLLVALQERRPSQTRLLLRSLSGKWNEVDVIAFPLTGQSGRDLGAVGLLWSA